MPIKTKPKAHTLHLPPLFVQCKMGTPSLDQASNTVTFSALDGSWMDRYDVWAGERYLLQWDLSGADLSRVTNGVAMFTDGHCDDRRIGKITTASIQKDSLILTARVGTSEWGQRYMQEISDDVEPGKSIEAIITELETVEEATYDGKGYDAELISPAKVIARQWQLLAVSTVSIPAIGSVGFDDDSDDDSEDDPDDEAMSIARSTRSARSATRSARSVVRMNRDPGFRPLQTSRQPVELNKSKSNPMPPELNQESTQDTQRLSQLETSVATLTAGLETEKSARVKAEGDRDKLAHQLALTSSWTTLRQKAEGLMLSKKLSKYEFDELFSGDAANVEVLLSASKADIEIELLTRSLTRADSRSAIGLSTSLKSGGEPLPADSPNDEAKAQARSEAYFASQKGSRR